VNAFSTICQISHRTATIAKRLVRSWSRTVGMAAVVLAGTATLAQAQSVPYPNKGQYNSNSYTFTAAATGDVLAYMVGGFGAAYTNELGLLINGQLSGSGFGLNNHTSSLGQVFNLGSVQAGDTLTFVLRNYTLGRDIYSNPSMNASYDYNTAPGNNHIYSTAYSPMNTYPGVPAGTYVAFEDQRLPQSDYNYNDLSFVFTNVSTQIQSLAATAVPEPQSQGMLVAGLAALAVVSARRRRAAQ